MRKLPKDFPKTIEKLSSKLGGNSAGSQGDYSLQHTGSGAILKHKTLSKYFDIHTEAAFSIVFKELIVQKSADEDIQKKEAH